MSASPKTPLAIALRYDHGHVPTVVAKGCGEIGQAIIDAAREHGVPLERNPGLAEALSKVELDEAIPEDLYKAVAIVLGFILRASGKVKRSA
jgi:flagellar biosynthesis protein